ncbi:MAG: hypothetical protein IJ027_06525 [Oscillospiraceae bacterium]|nr:hypothetical protein [Oscillospiraceae bacterium]
MKQKTMSLFVILGGVLGAFTSGKIAFPLIIIIIGGFCLGASTLLFTSVYSGTIWGIKIKPAKNAALVNVLCIVGLILGGYAAICTVIAILASLAAFNLIAIVGYLVGFFVPLAVAPIIAKKITENLIVAASDNALCLGEIELFKEIDKSIGNASHFVVGFEGVALFSSTNYCYAVYRYQDYQLGELTDANEVALVGTYFVQKYHKDFTFKVDVEVIPGEPGQTVVAVGTGGIGVARIQGTPDKSIFRSYIFTKR